jgi:hypothetical protein
MSGATIKRYTAKDIQAMLARGEDRADWARVDAMPEAELEAARGFAAVDHQGLAWFRNQGADEEARIGGVLADDNRAQSAPRTPVRSA